MTVYEKFVESTWLGREKAEDRELSDLFIMSTGLGGEAGEVLENLKKYVRDGTLDVVKLKKELGDVLYYLTTIGRTFGFSLEEIMQANIDKLTNRLAKGTMRGSGDDR
jgi:NTP pyrophosphatase (non-canonical NTP hydrolase)